jgi:hypothetical protein
MATKLREIDQERLTRFEAIPLLKGAHNEPPNGTVEVCALEAAAWLAREDHTDHPECVSPIIASLVRSWNDSLNDADRNSLLKPLVPKLINTVGGKTLEDRRAWMIVDWLARECAPAWLRLAKLNIEADALASCAELNSADRAESAMRALTAARQNAAAARAAAEAAAEAALKPTVELLQQSALDLVERMLSVTPETLERVA